MIEPVQNQPALIDQVHDRLVAAIADGTLSPGERLTQENMAEMLGVSRQPVSHALQLLRMRGLAIETGKRGLVVAPMDATRLLALYQVRAVLEGLAARLAAERVQQGQAPASQRDALSAALAHGQNLPADANVSQLIEADVSFHTAIYALSGNNAITDTVSAQWPHFMRAMGAVLEDADRRSTVWADHEEIADHILAGLHERAEEAARRHVEQAARTTAERLEDLESAA